MQDINPLFHLRLSHKPRIQEASCSTREERTYRIQQNQARPCCRVRLVLKQASYTKANRDATGASSGIT